MTPYRPYRPLRHDGPPVVTLFMSTRYAAILDGLAEGMSNQLIADYLHVSVETIRTQLKRLYARAGVSTRGELVAAVYSGRVQVVVESAA